MMNEDDIMNALEPKLDIFCPKCGASFRVPGKWAGRKATCKKCHKKFVIPIREEVDIHKDLLPSQEKKSNQKYCSECGELILAKAEICPKCGVRQIEVSIVASKPPLRVRPQFKPDSSGRQLISVLSIIIPIAGLIAGLCCINSDKEATKDVGRYGIKVSLIVMSVIMFFILWGGCCNVLLQP